MNYKHAFLLPQVKIKGTIELTSKIPDGILKKNIVKLLKSIKNAKISGKIFIAGEEYLI